MIVSCIQCGRRIAVPEDMPCPMDGFLCGKCVQERGPTCASTYLAPTELPKRTHKICPTCNGSGLVAKGEQDGPE